MDDNDFASADELLKELLGDQYVEESTPAPRRESYLSDSVLRFTNACLCVLPYEGWGWAAFDTDEWLSVETTLMRAPNQFEIQISSFFDWNGRRRGGVGRVTSNQSEFREMWTLFYTYNESGEFDFGTNLARYWIHIGPAHPTLFAPDHDASGEFWPLPKFGDCRRFSGMAVIADSAANAERELNFTQPPPPGGG